MNPTKTINPIHFGDLSPQRFEDMCLNMILRYKDWHYITHPGRLGSDGGKDIKAEYYEGGVKFKWVFQCKRYKKIALNILKKEIDKFVEKNEEIPDSYVLMLGCDISIQNEEKIKTYAKSKGLEDTLIWGASYMEAILYAKCSDLLFIFFGIDVLRRRAINVARIKRRLAMKKKIESLLEPLYADKTLQRDVIIHDVNRDIYPDLDSDVSKISPWLKLGYFRPYFRGVSFYLTDIAYIHVNLKTKKWSLAEFGSTLPKDCVLVEARCVANIPYDNIVDFEVSGDEYYDFPHFYCEFNNLGTPYEDIWYLPIDKKVVFKFNNDFTVWLK